MCDVKGSRRLLAGAILAGLLAPATPAAAQQLNLTAAEKTPAPCDHSFSIGDLAGFKAPRARQPYRIEFSVPSFAHPYIQALIYGAQQAARDAGVTLTVDAGHGFMDPASQITQLENALSHKPNALLVNPADPDGMAATIDDAVDAGIPTIDVGTLSSSTKSEKLVQDDFSQGAMAAETLHKLLPKGGQGLLMAGPPNASWARRRVAGFFEGLKNHPEINVNAVVNTDNDPQDGLTKFVNAAQAHPKVDWIYVTGFVPTPQSIPPEYRNAVYISGNLDKTTVDALKDGSAAALLPAFPVSVGYIGLALAVQKLNGETIPVRSCAPVDAMLKADAANPLWLDSNILPVDWVAPK